MNIQDKRQSLPSYLKIPKIEAQDWLIHPIPIPSAIFQGQSAQEIIISNGLICRNFTISPNGATIGFDNLMKGEAIIRGVKPEAEIGINGQKYTIGGLQGQNEYAYFLREWIPQLTVDPNAFQLINFEFHPILKRFEWKQARYATNTTWPPKGIELCFEYSHSKLEGVQVFIHYEMYDGIPLLSKWISVKNNRSEAIRINSLTTEILAMVELESNPQGSMIYELPNVYFESDYIFSAMNPKSGNQTIQFGVDPQYTSQVDYLSKNPVLLESKLRVGPEVDVQPQKTFESYRTYELVHDSFDRERKTLGIRKMYRIIAPWVTENPIMMHCVSADPKIIRQVVDQCVEVGFEMVILSFGSGMNMEIDDPEYYDEYKDVFDYAHSKGIEIGTYSLFSSRTIDAKSDVIDKETGKPSKKAVFGTAPCLGSEWGIDYLQKLMKFMDTLNSNILEHDGPYPGDHCASTVHPGHRGYEDSQWTQWQQSIQFYRECRAKGIYINAPDWYFLNGTNKTGMGYKEVNWSLPRERQVIIGRQNIYDGTWEKPPSMGWMFTPLTVYHPVGDWKESTLEPLSQHLDFYVHHLFQNFSSGVQSCYRGMRLYDTPETKQTVKNWVDFYKKYRKILDADIIHLRRPDGRHIDGILHVNPTDQIKGMAIFHNPCNETMRETFKLPLYYTGLTETAIISHEARNPQKINLDRTYNVELKLEIPRFGFTWYLIE